MTWIQALPLALLRIRIQPRGKNSLSPCKLLYGRPYQAPHRPGTIHIKGEMDLNNYLMSLGKTVQELHKYVTTSRPLELDTPAHPFQPGNLVYIKSWNLEPLTEKWKGPFQGLLTTYTAVKVQGKGPWIHYSKMKRAPTSWTVEQESPLKWKLKKL